MDRFHEAKSSAKHQANPAGAARGALLAGMMARGLQVGRALVDFVLPPTCPVCHVPTAGVDGVCAACFRKLRFIEEPVCQRLGLPMRLDLGPMALSAEAIADPPVFDRQRASVVYNDTARQIVHGFKYYDRPELSSYLARLMARSGRDLLNGADLIVPVPMNRWRLLKRRYNQAALLARELGTASGVAFDPFALRRTRRTRQQVGLDRKARARNVAHAFTVPMEKRPDVLGRRILLVDDVVTSGATTREAARALLAAGAAHVDVLAFALVVPGDGEGL